ncbi:S1 family peptidase [Corynebacterium pacaense]|uniref:S1 family peptidase n=1 Tax=Corynebacterium pacaense TaxID=1816684 RepID=UPI0009B9F569|nr:S1 family peptidase [Corynebacterium pacaense]
MHRLVPPRPLLTTSVLVAAVSLFAPPVHAAQWVDTAAIVDQANATFSGYGPALDRRVAEDLDASVNSGIEAALADFGGVRTPAPAPVVEIGAAQPLPNYEVRTDLESQIMAATPGEVVHRVQGSWFNAPAVPAESIEAESQGTSLYGPGTPIYLGEHSMCTLAVTGTDAEGRKIGITAGHCGKVGDSVRSADSYWVGDSGTVVATGTGSDYSVIELGSNAAITNSYNGVTVDEIGGTVVGGQQLCKTGVATGRTCGPVWTADQRSTMSQLCANRGDSGAPVLAGTRLVGVMSGGMIPNYDLACRTPLQGPLFMPSLSVNMDQILRDMDGSEGPGSGFTPARIE